MKNYNKNMVAILAGVSIVVSMQTTVELQALEINESQNKIQKNIEANILYDSNYTKSNVVSVSNENELSMALRDENIKIVNIKNDINLSGELYIDGTEKEIRGNGNGIKGIKIPDTQFDHVPHIEAHTDLTIDNLKLEGVRLFSGENTNLNIVNNSEINNDNVEIEGNGTFENVKLNNATIQYCKGNLSIKSSNIKDGGISFLGVKGKKLNIVDTEIYGKKSDNTVINIVGGSTELENVKIKSEGNHAIYAERFEGEGGNIRIKGLLEIEGLKQDAIVLKNSKNDSKVNLLELYIDGDIKQIGDTYTIKAEQEGIYTKVYYDSSKIEKSVDKGSNTYYNTKNRYGNNPTSTVYESKLVGENRYQTAIKVSNEGWGRSGMVAIVNSNSIADALSATPYANKLNMPILLTEGDKLNSETKKEILRLKATRIVVMGGEKVISDSVINELESMNLYVERIGGKDRYETSLQIAEKLGYNLSSEIVVVNGVTGLPDAVSIASVAADKKIPILLASPSEGTKVFDQYIKDYNIKTSYVIGGEEAISNEVMNKLPNAERLGGVDRNETNATILEKFYTDEELNSIYVAKDGMKNSDDLIDALSVGVLASKEKSPVIIVGNDLNDKQKNLLSKKHPKEIIQVGGNGNENAFNNLVNMFKN